MSAHPCLLWSFRAVVYIVIGTQQVLRSCNNQQSTTRFVLCHLWSTRVALFCTGWVNLHFSFLHKFCQLEAANFAKKTMSHYFVLCLSADLFPLRWCVNRRWWKTIVDISFCHHCSLFLSLVMSYVTETAPLAFRSRCDSVYCICRCCVSSNILFEPS